MPNDEMVGVCVMVAKEERDVFIIDSSLVCCLSAVFLSSSPTDGRTLYELVSLLSYLGSTNERPGSGYHLYLAITGSIN